MLHKRVNLTLNACYVQNSEIILIAAVLLQFTFKTHYKDFLSASTRYTVHHQRIILNKKRLGKKSTLIANKRMQQV